MNESSVLLERLQRLMAGHSEMAEHLEPLMLEQNLDAPSNTVGEQFWCVVGARESYGAAIRAGEWVGFSCSLAPSATSEKPAVIEALSRSAAEVAEVVSDSDLSGPRHHLLMDLLEHEAQHQGQLIRYVYALGGNFPQSWKDRWALRD